MCLYDIITNKTGFYIITDEEGSKIYAGSARNLNARRRDHVVKLQQGTSKNKNLQDFYYECNGKLNFLYVTTNTREEAFDEEQSIIDEYKDTGKLLNIALDARLSHKGRARPEEVRRKIAISNTGKKASEETREKLSDSAKHIRCYSVMCKDYVNNVVVVYESIPEISKATGILEHHIKRSLDSKEWLIRGGYAFQKAHVDEFEQWPAMTIEEAIQSRQDYFSRLNDESYGPNIQPIEMFNLDTEELTIFDSLAECSQMTGIDTSTLRYLMGTKKGRNDKLKILDNLVFRPKGSDKSWSSAVPLRTGNYKRLPKP